MSQMHRLSFIALAGLLLAWSGPAHALDLSAHQKFLRNPRPGRAPTRTVAPAPAHVPLPGPEHLPPVRLPEGDAGASPRRGRLMTLYDDDTGRGPFALPRGTRIPEGLRPLLTERKYPRQGLSLAGTSGSMLVPSPGVLEPGKTAVAVHVIPFDLFNINDVKYTDRAVFDTSLKLSFGAFEGFEIGVDKTVSNQDRYDIAEPFYINFKYQVPGNITVGGSFCTTTQAGYHSIWVGAGVPVAWVGIGANFGASPYRFTFRGHERLRRAKFGGYNYAFDRAEGYADPIFFLIGGAVPISRRVHFTYDFNGDRFSLGVRLNYQHVLYLDAAYVSSGDYERLPGPVSPKRMGNFLFGGSIVW